MSKETSSKFSQIPSITLNPTSTFDKLKLMLELPEMNVQTFLPNTKPATEIVFQLKQPSAQQAWWQSPL